jgi:hypothetical protein
LILIGLLSLPSLYAQDAVRTWRPRSSFTRTWRPWRPRFSARTYVGTPKALIFDCSYVRGELDSRTYVRGDHDPLLTRTRSPILARICPETLISIRSFYRFLRLRSLLQLLLFIWILASYDALKDPQAPTSILYGRPLGVLSLTFEAANSHVKSLGIARTNTQYYMRINDLITRRFPYIKGPYEGPISSSNVHLFPFVIVNISLSHISLFLYHVIYISLSHISLFLVQH